MNKMTGFGFLSWLGSFVLIGFQALSMMMGKTENWEDLSITDMAGADNMSWIQSIPLEQIQAGFNYLVTMPLYLLLLVFGGILIFLGLFVKE
jgi:hypothetical protein